MQTVTSIIVGFWMLPFLYNNLGEEQYAIWVLIGSVIGSFYLLDLGFNQAVTRYVARYIYVDDFDAANRIINTALVIYALLGIAILAVTLAAAHFSASYFETEFSNTQAIQLVIVILGLSMAIEFPAKAFPGIIHAYMRFDTIAQARIVFTILKAVLTYYFISRGYGIVTLALIMFGINLASSSFFVFVSKKLFRELNFSRKHVKQSEVKEIYHFSKWVFLIDATTLLKDKIGLWILAAFGFTLLLPIYYAAQRLVEYAGQFVSQALNITGPVFTKYYATNEKEKMIFTLGLFVKFNTVLAMLFLSGFIVAGKQFFLAWMGNDFDFNTAYDCLLLISAGAFFALICTPHYSVLLTIKAHKYAALVSLIEILAGTIAAFILVPKQGLIGAAISTSLVVGIIRLASLPYITQRLLGDKSVRLILKCLLLLSISCLFAWQLSEIVVKTPTWGRTIANGFASISCVILPTLLLFDKHEKSSIKTWIEEKVLKQRSQ